MKVWISNRRRHATGQRRAWIFGAVLAGVVAIAAGSFLAGTHIRSPDDARRAAGAPPASLVLATVERRQLSTAVTARGDASFARPIELTVQGDSAGPDGQDIRPVVTGRVPVTGSTISDGSVALEVSGRPVFVLRGALPTYRSFRPGSTGPDVKQLEEALRRLKFAPGPVDGVYDTATQAAVVRWYHHAGYQPVGPSHADLDRLTAANDRVRDARQAAAAAKAALATARQPPPASAIHQAQSQVDTAQAALERAIAAREAAIAAAPPDQRAAVTKEQDALVASAQENLDAARARLAELTAPKDTSALSAATAQANRDLAAAQQSLGALQSSVGTQVPRSEVIFIPDLPRRVDKVNTHIGATPNGTALTLSSTNVQVICSVDAVSKRLLAVGDSAQIDEPTLGITGNATVTSVATAPDDSGNYQVILAPNDPSAAASWIGANVRVRVPVKSTSADALVVPISALFTEADGTTKVRVVHGTRVDDVVVIAGIAADGYVAITAPDGGVNVNDQVVVGQR